MPSRLQLGTSRLEDLDVRVLETFLDPSWIHLGDAAPSAEPVRGLGRWVGRFREHPLRFMRVAVSELAGRSRRPRRTALASGDLYARTNFREFYYRKGDRLDFDDDSLDFVFSEHFLHHLFFDEALGLLRECHRVLRPAGVLRTVVPDADLRTYEPPEFAGFPDERMPFTAPFKHKTRYSVYLLTEALAIAGFEPVALRYCDRKGRYVCRDPAAIRDVYRGCPEPTLVYDLRCVLRLDSLVVDGIKRERHASGAS